MKLFQRRKKTTSTAAPTEIFTDKIEDLTTVPFGLPGGFKMGDKYFHFHEALSFYFSHKEILKEEIYKFETDSEVPLIIDCGANMGVSVFYFSKHCPTAKILAFEPEQKIFDVLEKNVNTFNLSNVQLFQKAVWSSETELQFTTDHGMGGSITNVYANQTPVKVQTVRLADYLHQPVDFLKLDIEGAEYEVLKDCEPLLKNVKKIFVEYHSFINQEQKLEEILSMLKGAGFRYHLKQSFSREKPFVDNQLACENMDMAITIFGYRW